MFNFYNVMFAIASTGVASLDNGLNTLKNISVGIIAGIGVIVLLYGLSELASSYFQHDMSQMPATIRKVVAGVIMISAGVITALFI